MRIYAFGEWRLEDFEPGGGLAAGAFKEEFEDSGWIPALVPGCVHTALLEAGRIEDPFYDQNEGKCRWIEDREWWYRASFDGPGEPLGPDERLRLVFSGLDTFATVYVNGEELGSHSNMFCEAVFDVSESVRPGEENVVAIRFDPPVAAVEGEEVGEWAANDPVRTAMRKAQYGYGWDWGPRLPTVGIWRPVELYRELRASIEGVHFSTVELSRGRALVACEVEADAFATETPMLAKITLTPPGGGAMIEREVALGEVGEAGGLLSGRVYLEVEDPQLWWTHDLGEPSLYTLSVTLEEGKEELESRESQVGIRTVVLDQSPDPEEPGTRFFRFILNGVEVFCRGANWIPSDSFVGSLGPERYERLISRSVEANMNMLRVWGGGVYEHDAFYDLCDERGVLVWQDFMFACAAYPEGPDLAREVEAEARYQVRRLRSHPSLALWCGNNENQEIHDKTFWQENGEYRAPGSLYYDEVLPRVVSELDGYTPYWPGSPYGGSDHNSMEEGDRHDWEVWHGGYPRRFGEEPRRDPNPRTVSYRRYAEDSGRFISEFGMHAAPVRQTLERSIPSDQLYYHSPSMDHHNKDNPKNKGDDLMLGVTGLPEDLEEYVDFSQVSQAEGLKFAIEHFRRRRPHCSGTLFWQLNDCWPVLSWSVIDYYGFGKAGYYYAKRAYSPLLASFKELDDGVVELWLTNDSRHDAECELTMTLGAFSGETLRRETFEASVPRCASHPVARWDDVEGSPERYLSVRSGDGSFPQNRLFFEEIKDLHREPAEPRMEILETGEDSLRVRLSSPGGYAYFVHLSAPDPGTRFSDNYLDLEPGESREVRVSGVVPEPGDLRLSWR